MRYDLHCTIYNIFKIVCTHELFPFLPKKIYGISLTLPSFVILLLSFYHFFHACLFYFVALAAWHGTIWYQLIHSYPATPFYCTTYPYQFYPLSSSMFYVFINFAIPVAMLFGWYLCMCLGSWYYFPDRQIFYLLQRDHNEQVICLLPLPQLHLVSNNSSL